jgi:prevent-host-death family protein
MRRASVTEAKNRLSALLDEVRAGETIEIVDRGIPVARLEPAAAVPNDADGRLARLHRAGFVVLPAGSVTTVQLDAVPAPSSSTSAVAALLDERHAGR